MNAETNYYAEVAKQMVGLLGGTGKLKAMINARDFVYHQEQRGGIQFKFGFKGDNSPYNIIKLTCTNMDLIDIKFIKLWGSKITREKEVTGLYNTMLIKAIEKEIGLYLTL